MIYNRTIYDWTIEVSIKSNLNHKTVNCNRVNQSGFNRKIVNRKIVNQSYV